MSTTTKLVLKNSGETGISPDTSFLDHGELALNYADGKLFYKNTSNGISVISLSSDLDQVNNELLLKAPIANPAFTGTVSVKYNGPYDTLNVTSAGSIQWVRDSIAARQDTLVAPPLGEVNRSWTLPETSGTLATTAYVDALAQGLHIHQAAHVILKTSLETLTEGTVTYTNGVDGVGAKLTLQNALTSAMLDGDDDIMIDSRIIVAGQGTAAHNGIYTYSSSTELIRATDFDEPSEVAGGDFVFVTHGATSSNTGWVLSEAVTSIGSDAFTFIQFSGAGTFGAGAGLLLDGTTFNVTSSGSGALVVSADSINLSAGIVTTDTYKSVTVDTYGRVTAGTNPTTLQGYGITDAAPKNTQIDTSIAGAGKTFANNDNGKIFHVTGANTLVLPAWSSVDVGWSIGVVNVGGSLLTVNRSATDTINNALASFTNSISYSAFYIYKSPTTDSFVAIGVLY